MSSAPARLLTFTLGTGRFAIPLLAVKEVIAIPEIAAVPMAPKHFRGLMNLRGQVIPVIDLRMKLGIAAVGGPEEAVIICDLAQYSLGAIVDSIDAVMAPKAEDMSPTAGAHVTSVFRSPSGMVLMLDVASALDATDLYIIENGHAA